VSTSTKVLDPAGKHQSIENVTNCEGVVSDALSADGVTTATVANDNVSSLPPPLSVAQLAESTVTAVTVVYVPYPGDCCPKTCRWKYCCWDTFLRTTLGDKWWTYRCYCKSLVDHRYFESFIIFMIMTSSVSLVNMLLRSSLQRTNCFLYVLPGPSSYMYT